MFMSDKSTKLTTGSQVKKAVSARDQNAVTILTSGCHFSGKLYCRGASRIGGRIDGHIVSEGLLIVEEGAVITAEIKAEEVIIQGKVQGKLHATGRVELTASSQVDGDISTPVLIVREGAHFNGLASMTQREEVIASSSRQAQKMVTMNGKPGKNDTSLPLTPTIERDPKIDPKVDPKLHKTPHVHVPHI